MAGLVRISALLFERAPDEDVIAFFLELIGERKLPKPLPIIDKRTGEKLGDRYTVETPEGNFNLRNYSSTPMADGSKPRWTIDIPKGLAKGTEIKFK